jgi:signal peptidase II
MVPGADYTETKKRSTQFAMKAIPLSRYLLFFAIALGGCALDLVSKSSVHTWLTAKGDRTKQAITRAGAEPDRCPNAFLSTLMGAKDDAAVEALIQERGNTIPQDYVRGDPKEFWRTHGHFILWLWPDVFGFEFSLNQGALFGIGQGMTPVFAGLSIAAAAAILWWLFRVGAARDLLLTTALGCVMAGILGNLYDRLGLPGLAYNGRPVYAVRDWILVMIGNWPWPTFNIADSLLVCGAGLLIWHAFWTKPETQSENG